MIFPSDCKPWLNIVIYQFLAIGSLAIYFNLTKQTKMASKNVTTVDTRAELAELVKRKAEIAV